MFLKYLFLLLLFYFLIRASGNLMRAMRGGLGTPSQQRFDPLNTSGSSRSQQASSRSATERSPDGDGFWGKEVEDARWEDLD